MHKKYWKNEKKLFYSLEIDQFSQHFYTSFEAKATTNPSKEPTDASHLELAPKMCIAIKL